MIANTSRYTIKSEIETWAKTPLEWSFIVAATGFGSEDTSAGDAHQVIHAALQDWIGGDPKRLHIDGEPEKNQSDWLFPFKIILSNPQDELQDVRLDAISLLCLDHDVAICHDGPVYFQSVLEKHCASKSCGGLRAMSLKVNLIVKDQLKFRVALSPLPQRLIDDVGRFLQTGLEDWADKIGPKLRTPVAETADVAEALIKITNARIEKVESDETSIGSGASSGQALVVDMSVGLLALTSATPVQERILQELPKDRDWVVDIMGLAAEEEEHLGDIGLIVTAVK